MKRKIILLPIILILAGCSEANKSSDSGSQQNVTAKDNGDGTQTANVDNSIDTTVSTSETSDLNGVEIEIPAGALENTDSSEVTIQEGSTVANDVTGSYLTFSGPVESIGKSVHISFGADSFILAKEIQVKVPIPGSDRSKISGDSSNFTVFQVVPTGAAEAKIALVPKDLWSVTADKSSYLVKTTTGGTFQSGISDKIPTDAAATTLSRISVTKNEEISHPVFEVNEVINLSDASKLDFKLTTKAAYQNPRCSAMVKNVADGSIQAVKNLSGDNLQFTYASPDSGTKKVSFRCLADDAKLSDAFDSPEVSLPVPPKKPHVLFYTLDQYAGNMQPRNNAGTTTDGRKLADAHCQSAANNSVLNHIKNDGRQWKALLFFEGEDLPGPNRYKTSHIVVNGDIISTKEVKVATGDLTKLMEEPVSFLLIKDQNGSSSVIDGSGDYWIGTTSGGQAINGTCNNWIDNNAASRGYIAVFTLTSRKINNSVLTNCNAFARLLCISQ